MADTLPLVSKIQQTSSHGRKQNTIDAMYGDGFQQIAEWGANAKRDTWSLRWEGLDLTDRNTLFNSYDLTTVWNWTAPGDSVEKQWRYTGNYTEANIANRYSIKLKIEQVFAI